MEGNDNGSSGSSNGERSSKLKLVGIVQNTNDVNIPNGRLIVTDEIMTSDEFLEEGYSIVTASGITYKLGRRDTIGIRRNQAIVEEAQLFGNGTPMLVDWDTKSDTSGSNSATEGSNIQLVGIVQNTNDARIPNGQLIVTREIMTSAEFLEEGYSVVTATGATYKLGRRDITGDRRDRAKNKSSPVTSSTKPLRLAVTSEEMEMTTLTTTTTTTTTTKNSQVSLFQQPRRDDIAMIDNWCMNGIGGVTGIISNSQDDSIQNEDTVTTSKIITEDIKEGQMVETINGSVYVLGTRNNNQVSSLGSTEMEITETPVSAGLLITAALLFALLYGGM